MPRQLGQLRLGRAQTLLGRRRRDRRRGAARTSADASWIVAIGVSGPRYVITQPRPASTSPKTISGRSWSSPGAQASTARARLPRPQPRASPSSRPRRTLLAKCSCATVASPRSHRSPSSRRYGRTTSRSTVSSVNVASRRSSTGLRARLVEPIERGPKLARRAARGPRTAAGRRHRSPLSDERQPRRLARRRRRRPGAAASSAPAPRRPPSTGGNRRPSGPARAARTAAPRREAARATPRRAGSGHRSGDVPSRRHGDSLHEHLDKHLTNARREPLLSSTHFYKTSQRRTT